MNSKNKKWPVKHGKGEVLHDRFGKRFLRQNFKNPNGGIVDFYLFDTKVVCQSVMVVAENGDVIVIEKYLHGLAIADRQNKKIAGLRKNRILQFPGGAAELGETFEDAARRETLQETGYEGGTLIRLQNSIWYQSACNSSMAVPWLILGATKSRRKIKQDSEEFTVVKEIPILVWINMIQHGYVSDCLTIAMTYMAQNHIMNWTPTKWDFIP